MKKLSPTLGLLALAMPAHAAPGTNWTSSVTDQVTALTTAYANQLVDLGNIELAFIAMIALVTIAARWQLGHMVVGFHPVNFRIGDFIGFLVKLLLCSAMLYYYNNPLPGGLNLHQIPQAVGGAISNTLDASVYDQLSARISAALDGTKPPPTGLDLTGIVIYFAVCVLMAVLQLAMFCVDAFGFVGYAVFALFGPLFIPLLLTVNFQNKFWVWLDGLIVFGMYRAVAQSLVFVWTNVLIKFFDQSVAGDYSLGNWMAVLGALIMLSVAFLWTMFKVPMLTSMLFGGVAGAAQSYTDTLTRWVGAAAAAAL